MKDRIAQILQKEDMTAIQFAKKVGINPSSLSHILSGRNKASLEIIMKIHKSCSYINLNWLLYGEGEMVENPNDHHTTDDIFSNNSFENPVKPTNETLNIEYGREIASQRPYHAPNQIEKETVKYIEKPSKKITEIRIFFDNGTYETFKPDK